MDANALDRSDLTDGFVVVRLANVKRETAPRTEVIKDDLNPRWGEEFTLMVRDENYITLEVFDSNKDNHFWNSEDQGIGFLRLYFRNTPGQWVSKKEKLRTLTYGKQMQSTLDVDYFFANKIEHLVLMEEAGSVGSSLEGVGTFLSMNNSLKTGRRPSGLAMNTSAAHASSRSSRGGRALSASASS